MYREATKHANISVIFWLLKLCTKDKYTITKQNIQYSTKGIGMQKNKNTCDLDDQFIKNRNFKKSSKWSG